MLSRGQCWARLARAELVKVDTDTASLVRCRPPAQSHHMSPLELATKVREVFTIIRLKTKKKSDSNLSPVAHEISSWEALKGGTVAEG